MAQMNCGSFGPGAQAFEAVVARQTLRALKALEALRAGADADAELVDESHGPGWFDSSWELENGLDVREGLPADAGLDEWLAVHAAAR
jgi:hypothetical protein